MSNYYQSPTAVIDMAAVDRSTFIRRTYSHLAGALLAFALVETVLFQTAFPRTMEAMVFGGRGWAWLVVLGLFMLVSHVAERWASSAVSRNTQYFGLGLYILAEAVIFAPMLSLATRIDAGILPKAALITTGLFLGLTWVAFSTKKDFSFLRGILKIGCLVVLGTIVASVVFGFSLGIVFSSAVLLLLGGCVLYQTSNVMRHYDTRQDVAAALALFASFATMLWYVIRILIEIAASRD